ncbi:MAG: Argininosuccinate lyase [Thermoanaerobaculia bacterium]|nr:Argininosuccinate lyase [Thermoanaerobaculia bacterium]
MTRHQLWGGGFSEGPSEVLRAFNDSYSFDRELFAEDVAGSLAWIESLRECGVLTAREQKELTRHLSAIAAEGAPAVASEEDVHSFVEARLFERAGPLAGKLHTGRSRNDQVATDFRLYLRGALDELLSDILSLAEAMASRARAEAATPMPGYTHLKRAEPVTAGHWLLAYVQMLLRDASRIDGARERGNECPLGAGALSGTPLAIDREGLARRLGFARASANSLDAVSDRDLAADYLYSATLLLVHLSRFAEDVIFFVTDECGFIRLPDALATGSSRMPHKKNPDLLELVRGHAGRALGDLTGFVAILKGLPLAYDKDLQLDKEPVFRVRRTLRAALPALSALVATLEFDRDRMRAAASTDRMLTTSLADAIAARGVPFREAHEIAGRRLAEAEKAGRTLKEMGPGEGVLAEDLASLTVERALSVRRSRGGTAPSEVKKAARGALSEIAKLRRKKS